MAVTRARTNLIDSYSVRRKHFARKRRYAKAFRDAGLKDVASQLYDCQETEVLACCTDCGQSWYIINRCRLRVCPLCSYEVYLKRAKALEAMASRMQYPKMITLTMPVWTDEPQDGIRFLRKSWNALRRCPEFKSVNGGGYQIELKPKPDGWHIHLHAIIDGPYLPYQRLFSQWRRILGVATPQVDIRAAKSREQQRYVCKYAAKAADFYSRPDVVVQWYVATKGQRLFATFGTWYNVKLAELIDEGKLEEFKPVCPFCNQEKTVFFARDGPFLYGGKEWSKLRQYFTKGQDSERPIHEIRTRLNEHLREMAEVKTLTAGQNQEPI